MKILHITNYYPKCHKKVGGAEMAVKRLIEKNEENKHYVLTLPFKGKYKNIFKVNPPKLLRGLHLTLFPFSLIVFLQSLLIFKKNKAR